MASLALRPGNCQEALDRGQPWPEVGSVGMGRFRQGLGQVVISLVNGKFAGMQVLCAVVMLAAGVKLVS